MKNSITIKVELPVKYGNHLKQLKRRYGKETVRKVLAEVLARDIVDHYSGILEDKIRLDETLLELVGSFAAEEYEKKKFQKVAAFRKTG